jgi:inner membrane transporter RhtA
VAGSFCGGDDRFAGRASQARPTAPRHALDELANSNVWPTVPSRLTHTSKPLTDFHFPRSRRPGAYPGKVKRTLAPVATIILAMISIQSGAVLAKQLFPIVGAAGATTLRLLFAAIILLLVWRPFGANRSHWIGPAQRRSVLLYGASLAGMNLLFYLSIDRIPLGLAVAFEFCGPLILALARSKRALDFVWVVAAVAGLVLLLPLGRPEHLDLIGVALALGAGVCWALYIVFGQAAGGAMHGGVAVTLGMSVAALFVLPVGVVAAGASLLTWEAARFAIAIAILSSALPYTLEMYSLQRMPSHVFSVLMSIEPAIAALSGLLFLRERLAVPQWAGIGLIMFASIGATLFAKKADPLGPSLYTEDYSWPPS